MKSSNKTILTILISIVSIIIVGIIFIGILLIVKKNKTDDSIIEEPTYFEDIVQADDMDLEGTGIALQNLDGTFKCFKPVE